MRKRVLPIVVGALLVLFGIPILLAQLNRPQPVSRPPLDLATMTYEDIRFDNEAQGVALAGMLFVPEGEPPFPSVVVIHGSGTSRRTQSGYLTLASYLQQSGTLVLLPDKRGSESSGGDWHTSSLQDLATDAAAAIAYLRTERASLVGDIGIMGYSQGGSIAPIVATGPAAPAFVINLVGPAVSMYDQHIFEENNNLRQMGFLPGFSNAIAYVSTFVSHNITQGDFWSAVGNLDPLPYWREIDVPVLVVYGDQDTNVPTGKSVDRLNSLGMSNIRVVVFEGSGHNLEPPPGIKGVHIREDVLELIRDFIRETVPTR